jgi:hypothetical protein
MLRLESLGVKSLNDRNPVLEVIQHFDHLFGNTFRVLKFELIEGDLRLVDTTLHELEFFFNFFGIKLINGHSSPSVGKVRVDVLVNFESQVPEVLVGLNVLLDLG